MKDTKTNKSTQKNGNGSDLLRLTIEQQKAIETLLTGASDREAAEAVGVNRETVTKWRLYHPAFQAELNYRRQELYEGNADKLRSLVPEAVIVLEGALKDTENPAGRTKAALEILKMVGFCAESIRPSGETSAEEIMKKAAERVHNEDLFDMTKPNIGDFDAVASKLAAALN